ncbi:MAG TPA: cytochrome c-type biogenesis protein [Telluria sp.]
MIRRILVLAWLACCSALAASGDEQLERRVAAVSSELRCLVCQNQTIADSQAGLAVDLRQQVREKLAQGMSEREVIEHVVARYGDFVLYRPPVKRSTWLLWFGPFVLLAAGLYAFRVRLARRAEPAELPAEQRERAARLLDQGRET